MTYTYTTVEGPEGVAAWLDRENAEKLHVAQVASLRAQIEYERERASMKAWLAFVIGVSIEAVLFMLLIGSGVLC